MLTVVTFFGASPRERARWGSGHRGFVQCIPPSCSIVENTINTSNPLDLSSYAVAQYFYEKRVPNAASGYGPDGGLHIPAARVLPHKGELSSEGDRFVSSGCGSLSTYRPGLRKGLPRFSVLWGTTSAKSAL